MLPLALVTFALANVAAPALPAAPARHFTDYSGTISAAAAAEFNRTLEQFERDTSSQVVVAVFPELPDNTVMEDFVVSLFAHWGIGRRATNNGVLLAVFVKERVLRIEVGYGLEGAIPDATANTIIEEEIVPAFRQGQYEEGLRRGINAILDAARGEHQGTGRTLAEGRRSRDFPVGLLVAVFFGLWALSLVRSRRRAPVVFTPHGRRVHRPNPWTLGGGGFGGWGGFGGGGFGGGGGGGGFSGGGGLSGGGGASGRW